MAHVCLAENNLEFFCVPYANTFGSVITSKPKVLPAVVDSAGKGGVPGNYWNVSHAVHEPHGIAIVPLGSPAPTSGTPNGQQFAFNRNPLILSGPRSLGSMCVPPTFPLHVKINGVERVVMGPSWIPGPVNTLQFMPYGDMFASIVSTSIGWSAYFSVVGADTREEVLFSLPPRAPNARDKATVVAGITGPGAPPVLGGGAAAFDKALTWGWPWVKAARVLINADDTVEQYVASVPFIASTGWSDEGQILPSLGRRGVELQVLVTGENAQQAQANSGNFISDCPPGWWFQTGINTTSLAVEQVFEF